MTPDPSGSRLYGKVLQHPFGEHVADWFEYAMEHFPMWSFQRDAFVDAEESELPLLGTLRSFVQSILQDEGLEGGTRDPSPLESTLDLRRSALLLRAPRENLSLYGVRPSRPFEFLTHLERWTPDWEPGIHRWAQLITSPLDRLGRELVEAIDVFLSAPTKKERKTARSRLDELLERIEERVRAPGRPPKGPPARFMKELYRQGGELLGLIWSREPKKLSSDAVGRLKKAGVTDEGGQFEWTQRLSAPFFSATELQILNQQRSAASTWERPTCKPTPKRFTVWILAHRLGVSAEGVAEKVRSSDVECFRSHTDPLSPPSPD